MCRYEVVRMFASGASTGSPLGVVPEASSLSSEEMLAVARALGTPETAFVMSVSAAGYSVRVFRPDAESPFGGHSAIGTAVVLARRGLVRLGPVVQECGQSEADVCVGADGVAALRRSGPLSCVDGDAGMLRALTGLAVDDVFEAAAREAGFGPRFHYLPVRAGAVARARVDADEMLRRGVADVMVFSWDAGRRLAHARMFAPGYGIPEDPACAPAALGLGLWLVDARGLPASDGAHEFSLRQGADRRAQSAMACRVLVDGGQVTEAVVSGRVVSVMRGRLDLRRTA